MLTDNKKILKPVYTQYNKLFNLSKKIKALQSNKSLNKIYVDINTIFNSFKKKSNIY